VKEIAPFFSRKQMEQAKTDENAKVIFLKKIHLLFGASNFYKIMELNKDIKEICKEFKNNIILID
jgi:hypothetical protein